MTNIDKLQSLIVDNFGFKILYPTEAIQVDCEECPKRKECDDLDVCVIDEFWNETYTKGETI